MVKGNEHVGFSRHAVKDFLEIALRKQGQEPVSPFARLRRIRETVERGDLPPLANGWRLVFDRRPAGQKRDYIPAAEYTRYFSEYQVPVAAKGHILHAHDVDHIPGYQKIFRISPLAALIQTAAANSVDDPETCQRFTATMDRLGDSMLSLDFSNLSHTGNLVTYSVNHARLSLEELIVLSKPDAEADNPKRDEDLLQTLAESLQLDHYASRASAAPNQHMREGFMYPQNPQ